MANGYASMGMRLFFFLLMAPFMAHAALPAFSDFDTTQFVLTGNKVVIKSGASLTNLGVIGTLTLNGSPVGGGGGDTIWTNSSGAIFPLPGSSEVVVSNEFYIGVSGAELLAYSPGAADGDTPYVWDTSILHTSGDLFELRNMGTNVLWLGNHGGFLVGKSTFDNWGYPGDGDVIFNIQDINNGDAAYSAIWQQVIDSSSLVKTTAATVLADADGDSTWILSSRDASGDTKQSYFDIGSSTLIFQLLSIPASGPVLGVNFDVLSAVTDTAFTLSTGFEHTSGNLFSLSNSNAPSFAVTFDGAIQGGTPTGGTAAAWKPGVVENGTFSLITTNAVEVDINGTLYKLAIVQ